MAVTDEQVAAYRDLVASLARRYNGHHQAEYDDLFQEGQIAVLQALAKGSLPSKDIVAKRMRRWVTVCARHGITGYNTNDTTGKEEANETGEACAVLGEGSTGAD